MDEIKFWELIESSKTQITPGQSDQADILQRELAKLPLPEIVAFDRIFGRFHCLAYSSDLWAAAYIIEGGCGDDGFMDFRAGLIGLGKRAYFDALKDPETLINQPARGVDFSQEEMAYAARNAYRVASGGAEIPDDDATIECELVGEPWDDQKVAEKYPKLAKHFGFEQ